MTSIIPSPYPIVHIAREIDTEMDPDTGNPTIVNEAPVVRYVQSIAQFGRRGSSREVISPEYLMRIETQLSVSVADPSVYASDDQMILEPELDGGGNYIDGTGVAYWIDGTPSDSREGPWPQYLAVFGGVVHLRRVT